MLDLDLIAGIRAQVPIPLVLHGSSGVPEAQISEAISPGMAKVNISTHLNAKFTQPVRGHLADNPDLVDPRGYIAVGRDSMSAEIARLLVLAAT